MGSRAGLVGTRLALVGALLYLSEWLVIPFSVDLPTDDLGDDAARWLAMLGVVAGALVVAGGVVNTTGAGDTGTVHDLADPLTGPPVALFWIWMIATSIVLFRSAPAARAPRA